MAKQILRFTASWCSPCKMLAASLQNVTTDIPIQVVDIDERVDLARQHNVRSVPTLLMLDDDKEVGRLTGVQTTLSIEDWIRPFQ